MSEPTQQPPIDLGIYRRRERAERLSSAELIAIALSAVWVAAMGALFLWSWGSGAEPMDTLQFVMTLMAVFLPVAIIWVAAAAARSTRIMKEEASRLQAAVDAMRQSYIQAQQSAGLGLKPSVERKLEEIAAAQRKTELALVTFQSIRTPDTAETPAVPVPPQTAEVDAGEQGRLALGTPAEEIAPPVGVSDFIRALNFPENAEDREGFRALRRALQDRQVAQLVQASQDVLTMLSQDGIYMDDLRPDRARPEVWRRFANGERGPAIAGLGGIRDRSSLALAAGRMRQDQIFRDAVHHFMRRFDKTFCAFAETASDADIAALTNTRTARAFMLLGRAAGTFT